MSASPSAPRYPLRPSDALRLCEPSPQVEVPEALLHDLWRTQRFDHEDLTTTDDTAVQVLNPGTPNADAGPDFSGAHLRLHGMNWRGDVELHTTSGGWFEHEHHTDPRYNRVVLHVTLRADLWTGGLLREDGSPLPELVLAPRLDTPLRELLHAFRARPDDDSLPCASRWTEVPPAITRDWIGELARERMASKRNALDADTRLVGALQERLFAGLGYAKNDGPMSQVARRIEPQWLRRLDTAPAREALLLGTAGLLPSPEDLLEADRATADYAMALHDHFRRLQVSHQIPVLNETAWTFFRLRPNNFPPLRLAQAAAWYADDALLSADPLPPLRAALQSDAPALSLRDALATHPPPFWRTHYHLTKASAEHDPDLGASRRNTLLVNAVAPVLLLDAQRRDDAGQAEAVFEMLRSLPASSDRVTRRFADLGTEPQSAFEGQGMHRLYREYCTAGGCLDCAIGQHLLDRPPS